MVDGFDNHEDMINSVCDGFINWVNDVLPGNLELLCNQDGYEILTSAFGREFRKHNLENASIDQIYSIASELVDSKVKQVNFEAKLTCLKYGSVCQS
ncbi:hypothetical protein KCM76_23750 [Zooshikella marina]|uniref:hypothetical protein n=1 Tax=Zooshikella ganghwensis TaxID=202772 RepID=UPI001BAF0FB8|nr:hypothetical protein [Zooshikella ganghwensis]MBU2709031.1 hypothetical protein [Zooshikella ganghwensis]